MRKILQLDDFEIGKWVIIDSFNVPINKNQDDSLDDSSFPTMNLFGFYPSEEVSEFNITRNTLIGLKTFGKCFMIGGIFEQRVVLVTIINGIVVPYSILRKYVNLTEVNTDYVKLFESEDDILKLENKFKVSINK